jgi:hypothetical protein
VQARDLSEFFKKSALEDPPGPTSIEAGAQLAEVLTLGASVLDMDPRARDGIAFLAERIRAVFAIPALATESSEALMTLWSAVAAPVMRSMDAIAAILHDAATSTSTSTASETMLRRLEHGDQVAVSQLVKKLADRQTAALSERLRRTSVLVSDARQRLRELGDGINDVDWGLLGGFRRGVLIWAVGLCLCTEIVDRETGLLKEHLRPNLLADAVDFVASGARTVGYFAMVSAGLLPRINTFDDLQPLLSDDDAVAFLVHASREIPIAFGPNIAMRLEFFRYPDAPDESEYHVVIDSPLPPREASERRDALCDDWWDNAVAAIGPAVFPVLGVIDDG